MKHLYKVDIVDKYLKEFDSFEVYVSNRDISEQEFKEIHKSCIRRTIANIINESDAQFILDDGKKVELVDVDDTFGRAEVVLVLEHINYSTISGLVHKKMLYNGFKIANMKSISCREQVLSDESDYKHCQDTIKRIGHSKKTTRINSDDLSNLYNAESQGKTKEEMLNVLKGRNK